MSTARQNTLLRRLKRGMVAETLREKSDRELVAQFLQRQDEAVFEVLVRRYGPLVYKVCFRVLRQAQDAEDAFQAAFLVLARKIASVRKLESLASWLHGVAYRTALKAQAQAIARRRHEQKAVPAPTPASDDMTLTELQTLLDGELERMPEKWRLPLILTYLEGQTQEEAAKHLGWSINTLRRRLEEGKAALGRRLSSRGVVWSAAFSTVLFSECTASATLPANLIGSAVDVACSGNLGQLLASGVVPANIVALADGVARTLWLSKLKGAVAACVMLAALAGSICLVANHFHDAGTPTDAIAADMPDVPVPVDGAESHPDSRKETRLSGALQAVSADGKQITLGVFSRKVGGTTPQTFDVAKDADIKRDGKNAKLGDLKLGSRTTLSLSADQKTVVRISAETPQFSATIKAVDLDKNTITILVGGRNAREEKTYSVTEESRVAIDGNEGDLRNLKEGDAVSLAVSDMNTVLQIRTINRNLRVKDE